MKMLNQIYVQKVIKFFRFLTICVTFATEIRTNDRLFGIKVTIWHRE